MFNKPIRPRKLYEDVAERLEERILDGSHVPGDLLPSERELMREFGVGRPAVREALFHLKKMGLIELRSGERAQITRPTTETVVESLAGIARHMLAAPDGVRSFQDARMFFEVGLARHAARHATDDEVRELKAALDANRDAIADLPRFERTDVAFHYILAIIPKNPIFPAIHAAIVEWLVEQRHVTLNWRGRKGTAQVAYDFHAAIYEAVAARDPDRAEGEMRAHLNHAADVYWEAMGVDH